MAGAKKGALRRGQLIVFLDETGFSQRPSVRRTWGPRGQTPVLKEHLTWNNLSAIGALGLKPGHPRLRLFLSLRRKAVNSQAVIDFLRSLRRHVRDSVLLIWDGLPVHRSKAVTLYVKRQAQWLTVERLPGYAPELNPQEDLWANLDACELANFVPDDLDQLARQVRRGLRRVRRRAALPWSFLRHTRLITRNEIPYLHETQ